MIGHLYKCFGFGIVVNMKVNSKRIAHTLNNTEFT